MIDKKYLLQIPLIISLIGCLLLIIGNFIPFVKIASDTLEYAKSFKFATYEGNYVIFVAITAIALIILEEPKYAICPLIVSTVLLGYLIINKSSMYDDCAFYESMFSWGPGLYIMIVGNIMAYIYPVMELIKSKFSIQLKN